MKLSILTLFSVFFCFNTLADIDTGSLLFRELGNELMPFTTDGCSKFPDGNWRHCCVAHDIAYWQGGTDQQRVAADQELAQCVEQVAGSTLAQLMYAGVRVGGYNLLPTSWHWGYGWKVPRPYKKLNSFEQEQVNKLALDIPTNFDDLSLVESHVVRPRESLTGDHCLDISLGKLFDRYSRPIVVERIDSSIKKTAQGPVRTLKIQLNDCEDPFTFQLLLLRGDACSAKTNEMLLRGRVRVLKYRPAINCRD